MHNSRESRRQPWQRRWPLLLLLISSLAVTYAEDGLLETNQQDNADVIIVDGFVDTTTCYANLETADANGNNDGKLQADEYVEFVQLQSPNSGLDLIQNYQTMPLVMQATFVTLTCLCRDERFGGDPRDVNCCLGVDAHIAIVGNDGFSTSQEATRLFATCFLTDQAIQQVLGSEPPSASPTHVPSLRPTPRPTFPPTESPTLAPSTASPTLFPTTAAPTTSKPTVNGPTIAPTSAAPTTAEPTTSEPTQSPTESTEAPTTAAPSSTPPVVWTETSAVYTIGIDGGAEAPIPTSDYYPDLVIAMDALATTVFAEVFATSKRRRNLQVSLELPTLVAKTEATNCTLSLVGPDDRCEIAQHIITLADRQPVGGSQVAEFEAALMQAILRGELQANLPEGSIVTILTGMALPVLPPLVDPVPPPEDQGLSAGGTAGIVIAALLVCTVLPVCAYMAMRRDDEEKEPYGAYEPHDAASADDFNQEEDIEDPVADTGTLGASPSDYGRKYSTDPPGQTVKTVEKVPPLTPEREPADAHSFNDGESSSSNAGSSGWSSSAGLSSLNTGSAEDSMDLLNSPRVASLAAIGAASGVVRQQMQNRRNISPMGGGIEELDVPAGAVSRNDLDNAIEAGDWAAVGATAALLAAASDSQSASSKSKTSRASMTRSKASSASSVDATRAAELDHLVDAGDWEGVVLAAAKFEAQEESVRSGSVRSSSVGSNASDTRSGSGTGTFTPSVSTSVSETASKARKRQEIRSEVEALVRRVVPEELDNVDEMMLQFKGREEELVETLRTMQERAVAQKARTAGHKAAKQEARRTVQRGGMPHPTLPAGAAAAAAAGAASRDGQSSASEADDGSRKHRTALEQAIEAGDWEAVGEAAALMSDASVTTASTAATGARYVGGSIASGTAASRNPRVGGVNANRARELDEMIDRGDWAAVVEAAGRFNEADKQASQSDSSTGKRPSASRLLATGGVNVDTSAKRSKQLQEEEDALAQAEIWMQIAQQSKTEGATDAGASDAADWAIARSLKSLKKAEQGDGSSGGGSQGGSRQSGADDDESV